MQVSANDYPSLKAFFIWASQHLGMGSHAVAALEGFEARSMAMARKGLAMAVGDIVEMTSDLSTQKVAAADAALRAEGIVTLTEVRARFWSKIRSIRKRGSVRNEAEYYALRNLVDALPEDERPKAWSLLAAYEEKVAAP